MDNKLFQELASSIQEAGKIRDGKKKASRIVEFKNVDVRQNRANLLKYK